MTHYNTRFIYPGDEWYIKAELPIPSEASYEGYPQIENGVGLIRSMNEEFKEHYNELSGDNRTKNISIATGVLAAPYIKAMADKIEEKFPNINIKVYTITNEYFGNEITVAGLITGIDLIEQLKDKDLGDGLYLPDVLLRHGETILLDDYTTCDIENALQTNITIVQSNGKSFIDRIIELT